MKAFQDSSLPGDILLRSRRLFAVSLAALCAGGGVVYLVSAPYPLALALAAVAFGTAVAVAAFAAAGERLNRFAPTFSILSLPLVPVFVHMLLLRDPLQSTMVALIVLSLSIPPLNAGIYAANLMVIEALWLACAFAIGPSPLWPQMALLEIGAIGGSIVIRQVRRDAQNRLTTAQQLVIERSAELSAALEVLRHSETALAHSERRYREVVDRAGLILYEADANRHITFINDVVQRVLGYTPGELLGRDLAELAVPHSPSSRHRDLRRELQPDGGRVIFVEMPVRAQDGRVVWLANTVQRAAAGAPHAGYRGIAFDITARLRAQDELGRQKRLFENLYRVAQTTGELSELAVTLQHTLAIAAELTGATGGNLMLLDKHGAVTHSILAKYRTDAAASEADAIIKHGLAGWVVHHRAPGLIGDARSDGRWLRTASQPYEVRSALAVPIARGEQLLGVITLMHPQPDYFGSAQLEFMQAAGAQIALALQNAQMYEAQKELARELAVARDAAETANRAKSAFLATVSHELRTPLAVILGFVETLGDIDLSAPEAAEIVQQALGHIENSAARQLDTVSAVLEYSRLEANPPPLSTAPFDPCALVDAVMAEQRARAQAAGNTLVCDGPAVAERMQSDEGKVRQVLSRLIENAVKFTVNGTVRITVARTETDPPQWRFHIRDTGIGMNAEQMSRLFLPFVQGDDWMTRRAGGAGLGLVISKRLVDMLGGTIRAESVPKQGTEFIVTLPDLPPGA